MTICDGHALALLFIRVLNQAPHHIRACYLKMDPTVTAEEQTLAASDTRRSQPLSALLLSDNTQEGIVTESCSSSSEAIVQHEDDAGMLQTAALRDDHSGSGSRIDNREVDDSPNSENGVSVTACMGEESVILDTAGSAESDVMGTPCHETEVPAIVPYSHCVGQVHAKKTTEPSVVTTSMEDINSEFQDFEEQVASLERECSSLRINNKLDNEQEVHASQTEHHREMYESTGDSVHKAYSELYNAVPMDVVQRMHAAIKEIPQVTKKKQMCCSIHAHMGVESMCVYI